MQIVPLKCHPSDKVPEGVMSPEIMALTNPLDSRSLYEKCKLKNISRHKYEVIMF